MRVLFAPDWRGGAPYQRLLAEALAEQGVEAAFLSTYRRGFPLARTRDPADVLHLHWPDAYYPQKNDAFDGFRRARFFADILLATRNRPLVLTAHNLYPHNRLDQSFIRFNTRVGYRRAAAVIAHSENAARELVETFDLPPAKCHVIPHGDLSVAMGEPVPREEARRQLGLGGEKLGLMFGAIEPYKGIEDVIAQWHAGNLAVVGKPISEEYGARIAGLANPRVAVHLGWLSDERLRLWLSAADCVLFNYRAIFTSGAACLARSFGIPLLIPERLKTVDLDEPNALVFRFGNEGFGAQLERAFQTPPDFASARPWREKCAWGAVAKQTAAVYTQVAGRYNSPA